MSLKRALPRERYLSLQREFQKKGALYEDRDFPPTSRSLFTKTRPSVSLQWKRPKVRGYLKWVKTCNMRINTFQSSVVVWLVQYPEATSRPIPSGSGLNQAQLSETFHFVNAFTHGTGPLWTGSIAGLEQFQSSFVFPPVPKLDRIRTG